MMNQMQTALIKKDFQSITSNKRLFSVLLIVPLVMTLVLPTMFVVLFALTPIESADVDALLKLLTAQSPGADSRELLIGAMLNNIMPVFFLMIPIMASSVMAASSFVGEKEKRTLETLLYCPLSLRQIFTAKIMASFAMSMFVSLLSFAAMFLVVEIELWFLLGTLILPNVSWIVLMLLVSPSIALIATTLIVRGSAKAQTVEESQQRSVFLILPVILLAVGQFTGIMLVSPWLLVGIGVVLAAIAAFTLKNAMGKFSYEMLLQ
ncbi:MAG: ABC transporter permease [Oscillospiraceae bacterium]